MPALLRDVFDVINGEFDSASRHGEPMSKEEYLAHQAQDSPGGECPVCGERPAVKGPLDECCVDARPTAP